MKCNTKSCQKSKNILANGFCKSCNEARNTNNTQQIHALNQRKVEIDVNEIETIYSKLKKGEVIEQNVINSILIGGVLNFLVHQENAQKLEAKVLELETELKTSKCRIESLENWMNKNGEAMTNLKEEFAKFSVPNSKVDRMEISENSDVAKPFEKRCTVCGEGFMRTADFENHMTDEHDAEKTFKCEICDKAFLLEWRMKKHRVMHIEKIKTCHFFLSKKPCPFEKIGCKFLHTTKVNDKPNDIDTDTNETTYTLKENQCHLCNVVLQCRDDLMEHVETNHEEYFQGMMEVAAEARRNKSL